MVSVKLNNMLDRFCLPDTL